MARPSKCTPALTDRLCTLLRVGHPVAVACLAAGVAESSYRDWRRRGREQARGAHRDFLEATDDALASAELALFEAVVMAATTTQVETRTKRVVDADGRLVSEETTTVERPPDPRAATWALEHRFSERWRQPRAVELSGPEGLPLEVRISEITRRLEEFRRKGALRAVDGSDDETAGPAS